ncbi:MAG: YggS family pyridoxal phosphate-dependent enzyme [Verrucomicrobiales bacterium]|nr:YggS family pyridoxal phosphate-dependent enzyme [Verrucomicrobiales bacterium]
MLIHDNISRVREEMAAASARAGRPTAETELLIVSKTFPPDLIGEAAAYPHRDFGESRVQEAMEKIPQLPASLRWHFIGHLQANKVRRILPFCEVFHGVHSLGLARDLDRIAAELGLRPQIYLQVNVADDAAKFGFSPASLREAFESLLHCRRLDILGLMTIPSYSPDPEKSRPHFAALRKLRDQIETEFSVHLPGLSMGMSGDFPVAIEEGATIVRVGSRIFGSRPGSAAPQ